MTATDLCVSNSTALESRVVPISEEGVDSFLPGRRYTVTPVASSAPRDPKAVMWIWLVPVIVVTSLCLVLFVLALIYCRSEKKVCVCCSPNEANYCSNCCICTCPFQKDDSKQVHPSDFPDPTRNYTTGYLSDYPQLPTVQASAPPAQLVDADKPEEERQDTSKGEPQVIPVLLEPIEPPPAFSQIIKPSAPTQVEALLHEQMQHYRPHRQADYPPPSQVTPGYVGTPYAQHDYSQNDDVLG
ncbi:hypothetical protein BLNAU_11226 [Blattamonas nauphoetae]|uniref:Uncharacterized protein n=1 Tax=Blattamonas nauphoetae TaxID=2049346 RepID=A0ABQ9XR10_9EUKA|nr:hypothetical protein BLNAU_11226 [Blattamonas nauphoetae]